MALELVLRQRAKRQKLPAETSLIPTCCVCGLVRAKKAFSQDPDRWITKRSYEHTYGVTLAGTRFTHTYCSGCHIDFMQRVRPVQKAPDAMVTWQGRTGKLSRPHLQQDIEG